MHEVLDTLAGRSLLENAEERGFVEPAELEALALELDLGDDEIAEVTHDLESIGLEVGAPVEEPDELIEILPRVHTIVHLVGGVNQPSDEEIFSANHGSTVAAVTAAKEAGVRRLILLSVPGAAIDHPHPFMRAKGLAEEVIVNSGLEYAVLRSSHAYGLGGLWFTSTVVGVEHGFVVGDGTQRRDFVYVTAPLF